MSNIKFVELSPGVNGIFPSYRTEAGHKTADKIVNRATWIGYALETIPNVPDWPSRNSFPFFSSVLIRFQPAFSEADSKFSLKIFGARFRGTSNSAVCFLAFQPAYRDRHLRPRKIFPRLGNLSSDDEDDVESENATGSR